MSYRVLVGDVAEVLPTLEPASFDAVLCDPPYGISFMGRNWDHGVPSAAAWRDVLRVLRPGAPLVAFGGTRTYHRLVVGIEDAGFEIRDCLMWLYASGFPKSLDLSKAIDKAAGATREVVGARPIHYADTPSGYGSVSAAGSSRPFRGWAYDHDGELSTGKPITAPATPEAAAWSGYGTALAPSYEPAVLAMAPLAGTFAANALAHGVGGLNIDGCRISADAAEFYSATGKLRSGPTTGTGYAGGLKATETKPPHEAGRWPKNLILGDGVPALLDQSTGGNESRFFMTCSGSVARVTSESTPPIWGPGASGYARFKYTAKVSRREREAGCEALPLLAAGEVCQDETGLHSPRAGANRTGGARNHHPTLKPIALTTYLARLLLPPYTGRPRRILCPFSGAGSEMIGALLAGWDEVVGIEREPDYARIAEQRLAHWAAEAATNDAGDDRQARLFDDDAA